MFPKITDFIQSHIWELPLDQLPRWLSPLIKQVRVLILAFKGFKVSSVEDSINHSTYFVLVDQKMQIRGYYDGVDQEKMSLLSKDIVSLLKEI